MNRITRGKALFGAGGLTIVASGTFTHAAGTIAGAGGTVYTAAVSNVVAGDIVHVAPNYSMGTATWRGVVSASGTVSYSIVNAAGTAIWSAGTVTYRVDRI